MIDSKPRDVQIGSIGTNTQILRARSWSRLRFEIEYGLCRGTTANSYLITADKIAIIDPPGASFINIYLAALQNQIHWQNLDYVILGHFSPNRIPTLTALLELAPQITFVCSLPSANNLHSTFPDEDLKILIMRGKETLDLGQGHILKFFPNPSPRWPEALCTYDPQTQILYTGKLFAAHLCSDQIFDDNLYSNLDSNYQGLEEDQKYYFNCLMAPHITHVEAALEKIAHLQVQIYGVGNGPLIRSGLIKLTQSYFQWSHAQKEREMSVALLYASAYGNTATLAQAIALGITKTGIAVKSINCEFTSPEEIHTTVEKADALIIGTPTIGGHAPTPIQTALGIVLATSDNSKLVGVFGSYGWSGEALDIVETNLKHAGFPFGFDTLKVKFKPDELTLKICEEIGRDFGQNLKKSKKTHPPREIATPTEQAVGKIVGSVCVLTTKQGEIPMAILVTWVSQATFKPPGITVAIAKERSIEYLMYIGSKFVLNIFSEGIHTDYIKSFRRNFTPIEYHLSGIRTIVGENSSPILADAAAYLECSVNQHLDCGDHWVIYATVDYGKLINPDGVTALTLPALKRKGFLAKI